MARFFIDRPIVAMVLSVVMVILGLVAMVQLPTALFPDIAPPEIVLEATYVGADALTVEESVATPIEQEMNGVDDMIYMYSTNAANGKMVLRVDFEVGTVPNTDQILTQMRYLQAESKLPMDVRNYGVTTKKSTSSPLALITLTSPDGTYDALFLANYGYVNIYDPMSRVPGVGQVTIFGAGQYAMRFWVNPDTLANLGITINEMVDALNQQNKVNPAGKVGGEPVPSGQEFTYTVRAQGRLTTPEQFGEIVVRANADGSIVRMRDVARIELGSQTYDMIGRLNGAPAAVIAVYQLPGSNAIQAVDDAKALMEELSQRFPEGLDYVVSLDTTLAVREGIREIVITLFQALSLVMLVVFIFLQGFRATLIPLLAVPVSLVGTFMVFPLLGFSINTLSLFGLVLAIGIVVDDAIVVVEAVEHLIAQGMSARDATIRAMQEVSAPIVATSLILVAVFLPTAFIPGITGRLYQQFAITITISVLISTLNALTLSPALSSMLLRPRVEMRGPLGTFFRGFNRVLERGTDGYVNWCRLLIRRAGFSMLLLGGISVLGFVIGGNLPGSFLPEEDQGYFYMNVQLPDAASLQRTDEVCRKVEAVLKETPGIESYTTIVGFSLLSAVSTTYSGFYFITLDPWGERGDLTADVIMQRINAELSQIPDAIAFAFPPPAIPGVGTSGGVTFVLEDRSGGDIEFLAQNTRRFLEAANQRPELARATTTFSPAVPQLFAEVDRDKVLKQGIELGDVYQTLQAFMGGVFVNYFNRFGRVWQVYIQAEGEYRTDARKMAQFFVRNSEGGMVPLAAIARVETSYGPEFTIRYNGYRAAQIMAAAAPGYSAGQAMQALEEVFDETMPTEMGYDYLGMSFQEKVASEGVPPEVIFAFSLLMAFLILAALYESWSLPLSVLLGIPIAVFGAFLALALRGFENNAYTQIGLVMLIGLAAKNAILIVEFARAERQGGKSIVDAALEAARLRLRPILMTALSFIIGVIPLAIASGAGSQSRQILGSAVIGGMGAATVIAIFLIPVSFYVMERMAQRGARPDASAPVVPSAPEPSGGGGAS